jgi:hypothetical protein
MDPLADAWKNLEPKSIHRGWVISHDDFGPEDDGEEGRKSISLQTFGSDRELQPEKHTLLGIQWMTWAVVEKSS